MKIEIRMDRNIKKWNLKYQDTDSRGCCPLMGDSLIQSVPEMSRIGEVMISINILKKISVKRLIKLPGLPISWQYLLLKFI